MIGSVVGSGGRLPLGGLVGGEPVLGGPVVSSGGLGPYKDIQNTHRHFFNTTKVCSYSS